MEKVLYRDTFGRYYWTKTYNDFDVYIADLDTEKFTLMDFADIACGVYSYEMAIDLLRQIGLDKNLKDIMQNLIDYIDREAGEV